MDVEEATPLESFTPVKKNFTCPSCDKTFSSTSNLNLHMKIHSKEKLYTCKVCKKSFGRISSLQRHLKMHANVEPLERDEVFTLEDNNIIPETVVAEKKIYKCLTCGKGFMNTSALNQHMKIHLNEKLYACDLCQKSFVRKLDLLRHLKTHNTGEQSLLECNKCDQVFTRKDNLQRHLKSHESLIFSCRECDKVFARKFDLRQHIRTQHLRAPLVSVKRKMNLSNVKSKKLKQVDALNVFKTITLYPDEREECDLEVFHRHLQSELQETLTSEIQEKGAIKWLMITKILLERVIDNEEMEEMTGYFSCSCFIELTEETISHHIEEGFSKITKSFEEFVQRGSGWKLRKILQLELKIAKYHPLAASSYIPLPKKLDDKKAVLNIKNEDKVQF